MDSPSRRSAHSNFDQLPAKTLKEVRLAVGKTVQLLSQFRLVFQGEVGMGLGDQTDGIVMRQVADADVLGRAVERRAIVVTHFVQRVQPGEDQRQPTVFRSLGAQITGDIRIDAVLLESLFR